MRNQVGQYLCVHRLLKDAGILIRERIHLLRAFGNPIFVQGRGMAAAIVFEVAPNEVFSFLRGKPKEIVFIELGPIRQAPPSGPQPARALKNLVMLIMGE